MNRPVKEIGWHKIGGSPYYSLNRSQQDRIVGFGEQATDSQALLQTKIEDAVPTLLPESRLLSLELIQQYDDYYYSHHNRYRPLPAYRARFDDDESTWYHIDMATGELIGRVTNASRRERWLFNGLHSLDFQFLLNHRPLWDIVLILLSLIGFGFSVTSIVIGWRRLTRN